MGQDPSNEIKIPIPSTLTGIWAIAYQKYFRMWLNLARSARISDDEAFDIVHSIIATTFGDPSREFHSLEHIRNYVSRAVLNRAIQASQNRDRWEGWTENVEQETFITDDCSEMDDILFAKALKEAVGRLPRVDFEIIKLRFYSGLSFQEISDLLQMSISTLKSREDAAVKRIGKWLRKKGFDSKAR